MAFKLRVNDYKIIELLLDFYAEKTSLPIAYYDIHKRNFIWSTKGIYSKLCEELNNRCVGDDVFCNQCKSDHEKRCLDPSGSFQMCHVGLWNIALPVMIGEKIVGALLSGQRRVSDVDMSDKSLETFNNYIGGIRDNDKKNILIENFSNTPVVEKNELYNNLFINLKNIQEKLISWLYEHQKDIREFRGRVHALAHEFLIPIQAIIADAENLYSEIENLELREISKNILDEMQKLGFIAENMRASIIGAKYYQYEFVKKSIYRLLIKTIDLYQGEANKKGIDILQPEISDYSKFPEIEMEYNQLQIAINNIIQNAVKYSYTSSYSRLFIAIKCRHESNHFVISFSNLGIGILPEEIEGELIFHAGYRGKLSADRFRTGSGLGLSEVKRIIDLHNGTVNITSNKSKTSEAYKTTVEIKIPLIHYT